MLERKKKVEILHGISGCAEAGQLLGILGESGSGKTSLLDILARRISSVGDTKIEGEILCNGQPTSHVLSKHCAYIIQEDILLSTLTPAETF
eukprot:TRINITY_DN14976_c0_g1_i1.p1 TRINITY_DN14976_c0_g1~~TRINITY_DN14976_c0_g1_i1.p1  ORF type:complete len:92 (-),score=20.63 TRINITY_DN14976_c0_g1_i1:223-498(-)